MCLVLPQVSGVQGQRQGVVMVQRRDVVVVGRLVQRVLVLGVVDPVSGQPGVSIITSI